jgi:multidrug efflux pump subunit AcrA (membrane-fusion protein)
VSCTPTANLTGKEARQMKAKTAKKKKLLITVISLVLAAALGVGIWAVAANRGSEPVYVYEFMYLGMTEYWGDSQESYGPVTTDRIQTIYLTETQTVTEILVSQGDTVKKGDLLMKFDTTLSDLALERKRLDVEKLKIQLEDAKKELRRINNMKPMVIPQQTDSDTTAARQNKNQDASLKRHPEASSFRNRKIPAITVTPGRRRHRTCGAFPRPRLSCLSARKDSCRRRAG